MKRLVFPVFALVFAACGSPEPTTPAVSIALDPARIPLERAVFDLAIERDSVSSGLGEAIQSAERLTVGGRDILRLTLEQRLPVATMYDTLDVDASTLRPVRYRNQFSTIQSVGIEYDDAGRITGSVTRTGETTTVDTLLTGLFYDASEFLPLVPALELAEGFEAFIPVYSYDFGLDTLAVRVTGSGTVGYQGTDRAVWFVAYDSPGGNSATLSIDRENGRLLRTESELPNGGRFVQVLR